jgi:hypothetical protein
MMKQMFNVVLVLVLANASLTAAHQSSATAPATSQPAGVAECVSQLERMEKIIREKDSDGLRNLVLITKFPDAQERLDRFAQQVGDGRLADARIVPLENSQDGPVICVIAAYLVKTGDPLPDVEPCFFIARDGRWRLIHGSPAAAHTIMDDAERAATDRLVNWVNEWREANRETVQDRIKKR